MDTSRSDETFRVEKDLLGRVKVLAEAYYGIHAARARENFSVSGSSIHPEMIRALALVKKAAARANTEIGLLDPRVGQAIEAAADELFEGRFDAEVVVDPFQGGAGTSTNMNVNEIIANRAIEILGGKKGDYSLVHPLDHVNRGQSTNDVVPTALRVAALRLLRGLQGSMSHLRDAFRDKEKEFAGVVKIGRTEMQDAVPVTLGQEFGAYAEAVNRDCERLRAAEARLLTINLGGTAVGTGLNADRRYIARVTEVLSELSGFPLTRAGNMVEATQNADVFSEVSGILKTAAVSMAKISSDLRIMSSGPRAGFAEIKLPEVQAGSSIMPGKVNPVMTEMATQVAFQVMANDLAVSLAASSGQMELNAFLPLVAHNLLQSTEILSRAARLLADRCVRGIQANAQRCKELLDRSHYVVTAFSPYIGYEKATEVIREALQQGRSAIDIALERKLFTPEEIDAILRPEELTTPGIAGANALKRRPAKSGRA